jgi:hypothetical protein
MAKPTPVVARQHNHKPNGHAGEESERCPWCGSPISRKAFREITDRIEAEEKARLAKVEKALAEKAQAEVQKARLEAGKLAEQAIRKAKAEQEAAAKARVEAERDTAAKKIALATRIARVAEQNLQNLKGEQATAIKARLETERKAAAKKLAETINTERTKGFAERLKLTEQLEDLRRRLERRDRPAGQLGDEGELDAFTLLSDKFTPEGDEINRTKKFRRGGDIEHRIVNGAGLVLYEIKNHQTYQSKWTAKAKEDQLAAQADHVIIVTTAFPAGHRELMLADNGILVVSPSRLIVVAEWLRTYTIRSCALKLSNQHRQDKSARLYSFMTTDQVADRWSRMAQTVTRMRAALRAERLNYEKAFSDRGHQLDVIDEIRNSFIEDLDAIFEATEVLT